MTALATLPDLQKVMSRDLSPDDSTRALRLLEIASERVRTYTGRTFSATTETKRLRVRGSKVRLPQAPVTAVSAVVDMNGNDLSFEWYAGQVVTITSGSIDWFEREPYRRGIQWADVTYSHGYSAIPDDVIGIVCDAVAVALDSPPEMIGVQSETLGDYSVTTSPQAAGGVRLTQGMRDALANYVMAGGTIAVT